MKFTHTGDGETLSWLHAYLQSVRDNCNINMDCPDAKKVGEGAGGGYEYYLKAVVLVSMVIFSSFSYGQCAQTLSNGSSVDGMIAEAGSARELLKLSRAQIDEYDKWLGELRKSMNQGVAENEIRQLYSSGQMAKKLEEELSRALECRLAGS
ncbi:hypothetical protein QWY79_11620 [Halomonas sabkhae]|uniref:hypothetical protein n=1 Tax=Halomonas sabkhae TaxID=626223 RepID=UPI0025B3FF7C|nr:hypothetical protein [Halomonas sabkhae]MDN3525910.1 hypothetical protein [Halomonas sabkhae]